jgi:hypothetical protein
MLVTGFHLHVSADGLELALLRLFECLAGVVEHSAGVGHALAEEPVVEIVTAIVDVGDVAPVRFLSVGHVLPEKLPEVELDVAPSETKTEQLIATQHHLVNVFDEIEAFCHVRFIEDLHRDLPSRPALAFRLIPETHELAPVRGRVIVQT